MKKDTIELCTFDPDSSCETCINNGAISCKTDDTKVVVSHLLELSFILMSLFGILLSGIILDNWWLFAFYLVYIPLFFIVIQARITCSHCPYYAENRRFLHCSENHFTPKLWRYHPEPIARWEQISTILGFTLLGSYPILIEIMALNILLQTTPSITSLLSLIGVILGTLFTLATFYLTFFFLYCPHCLNFSCFFNKVPEKHVQEYLRRNPVIRNAWENKNKKIERASKNGK